MAQKRTAMCCATVSSVIVSSTADNGAIAMYPAETLSRASPTVPSETASRIGSAEKSAVSITTSVMPTGTQAMRAYHATGGAAGRGGCSLRLARERREDLCADNGFRLELSSWCCHPASAASVGPWD